MEHADISAPGGSAKVAEVILAVATVFKHVFVFNEATCAINHSIID